MVSENYLRYPTISEISEKDQDTWYEVCYGLKKAKMMPMCLVCGTRMGRSFRCKKCGYDLTMEYELNKTLSMLPKNTKSVVEKRENYQKQVLESIVSKQKRESGYKRRYNYGKKG